jgi:hypothetical protein
MRRTIGVVAAGMLIAGASPLVSGQKASAADVASRMTGSWTINWRLSSAPPGSRQGGRLDGTAAQDPRFQRGATPPPSVPPGVRANPTNTEPTPDKGSDLTPAERAERSAMRRIQEVPPVITVTATADRVTIEDERGEQSCACNGKTEKVRLFSVYMDVQCKWDKDRLRQEYATTRSKLIRIWSLDAAGHLVLKARVEGISESTPEVTTIYDRS